MMKKALIIGFFCSISWTLVHAQELDHTQYYLNLPGTNPAFTGIEDYLDTRASFRQGWNDFTVKNNFIYLSAYGTLNSSSRAALTNNTLRTSDPEGFKKIQADKKLLRKHGVGGMVTQRTFGPYTALTLSGNYSYHLPVSRKLTIAFGTKVAYSSQRINPNGLTVRDTNDDFYKSIRDSNPGNSSSALVDFGYTIYSSSFYLGISSTNMISPNIGGDQLLNLEHEKRFGLQAALTSISLSPDLTLSPGVRVVYAKGYDILWSVNTRVRYKDLLYAGVGYTNSAPKLSLLFGLQLKGLSVNYAYDKYLSDLNNFNVQVHELVIGASLFNKYSLHSKLW